jgi:hypothetical protein
MLDQIYYNDTEADMGGNNTIKRADGDEPDIMPDASSKNTRNI